MDQAHEEDNAHEEDKREADQIHRRDGDGQEYLDRSKLDFDPDDGLYSGTVVDGTTDIPGPHAHEQPADEPQSDS